MTQPNNDAHAKLIAELQGQVMHVPDMLAMFQDWPHSGRNKYYARLKSELDEVVVRAFPDEKRRKQAQKSDFALFASIWHPDANWERFQAMGLFAFWLFHIDDAMDENDGLVALDFDSSCTYRGQILQYTRYWLGLGPEPYDESCGFTKEPPCPSGACAAFEGFGRLAQRVHTEVFREGLAYHIADYLDYSAIEQQQRLAGETAPDFYAHLTVRFYTSGVRLYCYTTQTALGIELPMRLLQSADVEELWREINLNIIISNDILSAKKELSGGCVHNAVAVIYHQGNPLSVVIPTLTDELAACRDRFDTLAARIEKSVAGKSPRFRQDVADYLDGLRNIGTGAIEFCKIATRYGLEQYFNEDGSMDVVL